MANCSPKQSDIDVPKLETVDSLFIDFLPYNVTKKNQHFDHEFDKRSHFLQDNLQDKLQEVPPEKGKSGIELQLEKSEARLDELLNFGSELVNNIKAYNERQEVIQSQSKIRREKELQKSLQDEAEESLKQFEIINSKWAGILELKEPMAIHEQLLKQKEAIIELMTSKDDMIERCQNELKRTNDKYLTSQASQSSDVCFLVERIDNQIELMKKAYKENIDELQDTIEVERQRINNESKDKWNLLYEAITSNETKKTQIAKEKQNFYANELEKICAKQEEITRSTKIRLEKDAEQLELEIRKTRANVLMNSEKIDYNYQVLQKRNEENIIINNQQKRRVAKLNENIATMKRRLVQIKRNNKTMVKRLSDDIHKLHSSINDMQLKLEYFRKDNRKKFNKVWDINFKEIKTLFSNVMEIDRILYEQQLATTWEKPNIDFEALDLLKVTPNCTRSTDSFVAAPESSEKKKHLNNLQLHDILKKIADRAGFLVESRLLDILKPYSEQDQCLVRIENIFSALRITDYNMVENLFKYFEPYSYCPNCSNGLPVRTLKALYSFRRETINQLHSEEEKRLKDAKDCPNHYLVMEPALVLTSLNEFTSKQFRMSNVDQIEKNTCKQNEGVNLLQMEKDDIESYWKQFEYYLSKDKQNVWRTVEHGLNHYLEVLKKREQLDKDCVFLQKQNSELKFLLQKF